MCISITFHVFSVEYETLASVRQAFQNRKMDRGMPLSNMTENRTLACGKD